PPVSPHCSWQRGQHKRNNSSVDPEPVLAVPNTSVARSGGLRRKPLAIAPTTLRHSQCSAAPIKSSRGSLAAKGGADETDLSCHPSRVHGAATGIGALLFELARMRRSPSLPGRLALSASARS